MNEIEALAALARAFPGLTIEPTFSDNPAGLAPCVACPRMTFKVDDQGVPYHPRCKRRAMGLSVDE